MVLTWEYFHENKHSLKYAGFWFVCQKSQKFFTHLHFCRENFWCLIRRINFFERWDISLLFPWPLSEMKNIFFRRCAILPDPRQSRRLKMLDFPSPETVSLFFCLQKKKFKMAVFFWNSLNFESEEKECKLNIPNRLQAEAGQNTFSSALYLRKKVYSGRFFKHFFRHDWKHVGKSMFRDVAQNQSKRVLRCAVPWWKRLFWTVFQAFLNTLMEECWQMNVRKCSSKPAKTCFEVRCAFVKKAVLEGFSSISWDIDEKMLANEYSEM